VVLDTGHTSCVEAPGEFAQVIRSVVEQGVKAGIERAD
jgi:3-oxoadipate enol-lactonase